uniref:Uncharacterized protein n=1 Tax=Meloidogyne javanica TaxID=6303 RepID=A0A915M9P5_MELJA
MFEEFKDGMKAKERSKLLELLIKDRNESLAFLLRYTLYSTYPPNFDILYEIILARPNFELKKIIEHYDKITGSKLERVLFDKKESAKHDNENAEIWHILFNRVKSVEKNTTFDKDEFNKHISIKLPKYMQKMLKITRLVGSGTYLKDIAERTIEYIEKGKYDELLTLVVIHHGSDFVEIAKILRKMSFKTENLENDAFERDDSGTSDDSDDDPLSSNLMCLYYTEEEYETEMTMGTLEYDWSEELRNFEIDLSKEIEHTREDIKTVEEWRNGRHENSISNRFGELKKGCDELKKLMNKESEFTCSRYYPITDSNNDNGSKSLLRILESIQILSVSILHRKEDRDKEDKKLRWQLVNKLFLPLPQWRRQETAQLYCEKFYNIQISKKILEVCNDRTIDNSDEILTEAFTEILINFEISSDIVSSFVKKFKKCGKKIFKTQSNEESQDPLQNNNAVHDGEREDEEAKIKGLPQYIKKMLIVTGFAGNEQYYEDIAKRIMSYNEKEKYEGDNHINNIPKLLSMVVIHFGNDFSEIITNLKQKSYEYTKKIEKLEDEIEKITAKDLEITKKRTKELEKKLKELKMMKEKHLEESRTLKLKSPMTEESSNIEEYVKEEEKLKNELEEIKIKKRLKAQFREHDGKFKTKEKAKDESAMSAKEKEIYHNQKLRELNMTEEEESKMKEESEKVRRLKDQVQDEERNFVEKNSELLKLKNLQKIDKDKYGLFSVFNYMLMIKEFNKDECYEESVKEFEFERQLGVLDFLQLTVKEKLVKFEAKFKSQYHPQNKIVSRKDFVTLKDWLNKFPAVPQVPAVPQISTSPKHLDIKKEKHPKQMIGEHRGEGSRMLRRAKSMDAISKMKSPGILDIKEVPQPPYGLHECSRFHTNSEVKDGRKPLFSILKEIKTSEQPKETRWYWINKLFLPLPQWRREETALLYCKNELEMEVEQNLSSCLGEIFNEFNQKTLSELLKDNIDEKRERSKLLELLIKD